MLFMETWKGEHDRWLATLQYWSSLTPEQRADLGEGLTLVGRWHDLAARRGVAIVEAADAMAVQRYSAHWSPYMDVDITPVVEDEESAVLAAEVVAAQTV